MAVILWMVVVNVEDPDRSAVFTVPVEITNTDYLTEMGKTYEVLDNTDMVSFVVSGPRSVVENLEASDFTVTADMENIDATMSMVPIIVSAASNSSQIDITQRNSFLIVQVENLVTENFRVDVETEGTLAEDCFVDEVSSSVKSVTVVRAGVCDGSDRGRPGCAECKRRGTGCGVCAGDRAGRRFRKCGV